ncbi:mRNA splicing protein [Rhodotorula kratochvilovae]
MSGKLSREEYRRQKDLEAARKAGTAAPALDEEGKPINPHIPEFMANAPWYLKTGDSDGPSLKHHKANIPKYNRDPSKLDSRFERGAKAGPAAKKFRPGACTNCGAMTHSAKDCLERPRKVGARYSGRDIAPDEVVHDDDKHLNGLQGQGDYDAKRDRWDGYDPAQHKTVVEEYEALEAARRKLREEEIDKGTANAQSSAVAKLAKKGKGKGKKAQQQAAEDESDEFGSSDESDAAGSGAEDEDKYAEGADVAGQKLDTKTRVTVRNLRIREDTAKYLLNLDTDSAYYDPKTRSMREAPNPDVALEDAKFAGENFVRHSGTAQDLQKLQLFAWQSESRGHDVHLQSNPTAAALAHKEFLQKKDVLKDQSAASILDRYGGEEYLQAAPRELRAGQDEGYVEYDRRGKVVKGMERAKARSKYDEDVFPGNHHSVWGSWYNLQTGQWGYACCHSPIKGSYCAGQAGIEAAAADAAGASLLALTSGAGAAEDPDAGKSLMQLKRERDDDERRKRKTEGEGEDDGREGKKRKEDGDKEKKKGGKEGDFMGVTEAEMALVQPQHRTLDTVLEVDSPPATHSRTASELAAERPPDSSSAEGSRDDMKDDSGGAGNETDIEDEDGLGDEEALSSSEDALLPGTSASAGRAAGRAAMYPFPSTDGDAGSAAHLHYATHRRRSVHSAAAAGTAPPSSAEVLLSSATSASSGSDRDDDSLPARPTKRIRLRQSSVEHPSLPRLRRIGALGISVHSDSDPDEPNVSGLDSADRRVDPGATGEETSDTRATDLGISSGELRSRAGASGSASPAKRERKRRVVADATFRGVVDELAVQNRQLRERLKRYEAEGVPTELKQDRLFEIRFFEGLPSEKRFELEDYLTRYVQTYAESAFRPANLALNPPARRPDLRDLAGPSNSGVEPASFSGTGSGIRLPPKAAHVHSIPVPIVDTSPISDPRAVAVAHKIVDALEALFQTSLLRTAHARTPPAHAIPLPPLDPSRMVPNLGALSASNETYFANLLSHDFLSQGFVYLNLALTMAQIHRFSVTVSFVQRAVRQFSHRLELSDDGGRIRWNGPRTPEELQQLVDPLDTGDVVAFAKGKGKGKAVDSVDGASSAPSRSTLSGSNPSSKETIVSSSSGQASSRDPSSGGTNLLANSLAPSSRTGATSLPSSGRDTASKEPIRPARPTAAVLQPMDRLKSSEPEQHALLPPPSPQRQHALSAAAPDSSSSKVAVASQAPYEPPQNAKTSSGGVPDGSDALSAANLDAHNHAAEAASQRTRPDSEAVVSVAAGPEKDRRGTLVFYGNGLFCSDLSKEEDGPITPPALSPAVELGGAVEALGVLEAEEREQRRSRASTSEGSIHDEAGDADAGMLDIVDGSKSSVQASASDGSVAGGGGSGSGDGSAHSSLARLRMSGMTPTFPADFFTVVVKTRHPPTQKRSAADALPTPDSPLVGGSRPPSFSCLPPDAKRPRLAPTTSAEIVETREIYHHPKVRVRQPLGPNGLRSPSNSSGDDGEGERAEPAWRYGHLLTSSNLAKHSGDGAPRSPIEQPIPTFLPPTPSPPHDDYLLSLSAPSHAWAPQENGFHTSLVGVDGGGHGRRPHPPKVQRPIAPLRRVLSSSVTTAVSSMADEGPISLDDVVDVPHRARMVGP